MTIGLTLSFGEPAPWFIATLTANNRFDYMFLSFLYDEASGKIREQNAATIV